MDRIFGRKKEVPVENKEPAPDIGAVSSKIDGRVTELDTKINALDKELKEFQVKIKGSKGSAQAGYKKRALMVLKRKKQYESQRDSLASQSFNIGNIAFSIESAKDTAQTVAAMKEAKGSLAVAYKGMEIDDIYDLQDDLTDLMLDAEEIQEVMSRSYGVPDAVDEDDLMDELAALEDEWEGEAKGTGAADYLTDAPTLPSVPTGPMKVPVSNNGRVAVGVDEYGLPL